jgi:hypothetical protein
MRESRVSKISLSHRAKTGCWLLLTLAVSISGLSISAQESVQKISAEDEAFFETHIRPLLVQKCSECHGANKQESDFRVDSIASLLSGGASGEAAVVPGKPEQSLLLKSVQGDGDYSMPPDESLSAEEIAHLQQWVQRGAPWPASAAAVTPLTASQRVNLQRQEHWALQPLSTTIPPVDLEDQWSRTPLDRWVHEGLKSVQLQASPDASRPQLLRRTKLDLLGVPPTYEEVQEFMGDPRPDAFDRWLDRYLASPSYGERWGRHWMDVARYADTRGYAFNRDRRYPYAYTYRDYVIQALNDDLPYDQFVLEQLAADQLELGEEKWRLAGLGFLTVGRKFNNAHDDIDDKIDVVTRGLMGLTVACARCHDHKYDAIPTEDYYSLYGVFASSDEPGELPLIADQDAIARNQGWFDELEKLKQDIETYTDERHAETEDHARTRVYEYLVAAVYNLPEDKKASHPEIELDVNQLKIQLRDRWRRWIESLAQSEEPIAQVWRGLMELGDEATEEQAAALRQTWLEANSLADFPLLREALTHKPWKNRGEGLGVLGEVIEEAIRIAPDQPDNPEVQKLATIVTGEQGLGQFNRGNTGEFLNRADRDHLAKLTSKMTAHQSEAPAELGRAMVLQDRANPAEPVVFIRGNPRRRGDPVPRHFVEVVAGDAREAFENGSGRLDLAEAIIDPTNPLTPRVIVNRVWMHHFRDPLVATPSDFGIRCDEPVQRQLLDQMALDLQNNDWSLKELHRDIVLSTVYRQASGVRPEAVEIDPENQRLWKQNRRRLGFEATRDSLLFVSQQLSMMRGGKSVDVFNQVDSSRRSVYAYIDRQDLPGLLRSFDFASPDQHAPARPRTVVPQQALYLMNSEFVRHRAEEIVERTGLTPETPVREGIQSLFRQVLAREAAAEEVAALEGLATAIEVGRWEALAQVLLETNELVYVD